MKNPFGKNAAPVPKPPRNAFDLSHQTLFTAEFGRLYPVFCEEVLPGDSFKINAKAVINSMPTVFPVNTRVRANLHYFYVRNRTLWKDWEDFIFNTKTGLVAPYLSITSSNKDYYLKTGSLGDFLGLPTSFFGENGVTNAVSNFSYVGVIAAHVNSSSSDIYYNSLAPIPTNITLTDPDVNCYCVGYSWIVKILPVRINNNYVWKVFAPNSTQSSSISINTLGFNMMFIQDAKIVYDFQCPFTFTKEGSDDYFRYMNVILSDEHYNKLSELLLDGEVRVCLYTCRTDSSGKLVDSSFFPPNNLFVSSPNAFYFGFTGLHDASEDTVYQGSPFLTSNGQLRVSALPFRAYEMVMNYFYRNDLNNPYYIDGEVQYNRFIPTDEGGADANIYDFHNRNWELDRFTSCVPNPQFGDAPLVGITYNGGATATLKFATMSENVDSTIEDIPADNKMTTFDVEVGIGDDGVIDNIVDYDKDIPSGSLRNIMDLSTYGISINDLRNVNSFQRFLENTMRRGLRYRNQLLSHLGVSVDYPDIDVPQFIGGASSVLGVQEVTNQAASEDFALGDFNGRFVGGLEQGHDVRTYCPEHGFIIGVFSLSPVPTYPQVCKKYLLKHSPFSYFQSEFKHTGYVPVTMSELAPLQTNDVDMVFGYQRAFYEYLQSLDEVHGDFRLTLKDFVLTRVFGADPSLGEDFTKIKSDQLNDIWATDNLAEEYGSSAKIFVQMYFATVAKRQIPRYGIARLE